MKRLLLALITAAALAAGAAGSALATGPDDHVCGTPGAGEVQASLGIFCPFETHP